MRESRIIYLKRKLNPSVYEVLNANIIKGFDPICSASIKSVRTMASLTTEMEALLPAVIGASKESKDVNYQALMTAYFNNWFIHVPNGIGYEMETGFVFDIENERCKKAIEQYCKENKIDLVGDIRTVESKVWEAIFHGTGGKRVMEEDLYRYAFPINVEEYISYRTCLLLGCVANQPSDLNKSGNIRFYLHSKHDEEQVKQALNRQKVDSIKLLTNLFGDEKAVEKMTAILVESTPTKVKDYINMDKDSLEAAIVELRDKDAVSLNDLYNDALLLQKATLSKLLYSQVIIEQSNGTITDGVDPTKVLGANKTEAITYLAIEDNKEYKTKLFNAYKQSVLNNK